MADIASEVVVTGVSPHGIGEALCLAIASREPKLLIITGRDLERPRAVQTAVLARYPNAKLRIVAMDLASNESVKRAADDINQICAAGHGWIDVLVNNAGVMCLPERQLTRDNIEMHLQINYIGHYLLTLLLLDQLAKSPGGGRVVNVSSSSHAISPFRFSDPAFMETKKMERDEWPSEDACRALHVQWTLDYLPLIAYGQSKTAQILHAVALSDLAGKSIVANSVNPGGKSSPNFEQSQVLEKPNDQQWLRQIFGVICQLKS
jgi:NAD(P)-dependent dehydrogenase (short-subunit alcohol dehydrogenase family)